MWAIELFNNDPVLNRTNFDRAVKNSHLRMFRTIVPMLEARLLEYWLVQKIKPNKDYQNLLGRLLKNEILPLVNPEIDGIQKIVISH